MSGHWINTVLCGPGGHQAVMDEIELGRQPAKLLRLNTSTTGVPMVPEPVWTHPNPDVREARFWGSAARIRATEPRPSCYVPPASYLRIALAEKARAIRLAAPALPPMGQLPLFDPAP